MQLSSLLAHHARYRPHATAVVFEEQRLDYREFSARIDRVAHALLGLGIGKGERVASLLPNCLELLDLYWACARIGAVAVPLSPLLTGTGLASLIADAGARCLLTRREFLPVVEEVLPELPTLAPERVLLTNATLPPWGDYAALGAAALDGPPPDTGVAPCDLFNIMYTSGTTGLPKGIMHSHRVRANYALLLGPAWRMTPESVVLHTGAIVFNGAFVTLMPAFHLGATYILQRQFDAATMIETIAREKVTHIMVVPAQIIALLDSPAFDPAKLASLQMILSLGAPLAQARKDQLNTLLPGRFHELYGLTEGFLTILDKTDAVRKSGVREGLVLVNAMHISASVFINDDERGLHHDYDVWLEKLAPHAPTSQYRHNDTGEDNADAHLTRQVMGREVVVAITKGRLDFGPWERIFYGEFDGRRKKRVLVKVIGE